MSNRVEGFFCCGSVWRTISVCLSVSLRVPFRVSGHVCDVSMYMCACACVWMDACLCGNDRLVSLRAHVRAVVVVV